jgi:hypothetical protein
MQTNRVVRAEIMLKIPLLQGTVEAAGMVAFLLPAGLPCFLFFLWEGLKVL